MDTNQKIAAFLARADAKPAPSKIADYETLIRQLRYKHWTYTQIAEALKSEFGVQVNPKTVWAFLKVRRGLIEEPSTLRKPTENQQPMLTPKRRFNLDA